MPLVPVAGASTVAVTLAAAAPGKKHVPLGWSITSLAEGSVVIQSGGRTIHTIVSPNVETIDPHGLFRWDNLIYSNEALTMVGNDTDLIYGGSFVYQSLDTQYQVGTPIGLLLLLTRE